MADYTKEEQKVLTRLIRLSNAKDLYYLDELILQEDESEKIFAKIDIIKVKQNGTNYSLVKKLDDCDMEYNEKYANDITQVINDAIKRRLHTAVNKLGLRNPENIGRPKTLEGIVPGMMIDVKEYINNLCEEYPEVVNEENPLFD